VRAQDSFADSVVSYVSGTGISSTYKNSASALGAPVSGSDGTIPYGILYPAYKNTQIVGIGTGGELTLGFDTPITNDPADHAFGLDFTIFGNDFFALGSGSKVTGLYDHTGLTVWVSPDNTNYYELIAPYGADDGLPEEGDGNPLLPVDPSLTLASFDGLTKAQVLSAYAGSAGGASYSISWAVDSNGDPVDLSSISYIKIEGSGGSGYVDAVARVGNIQSIPEPGEAAMALAAALLVAFRRRAKRGKHSPEI
jgi:hypothetical protein